jgi:hypothetical protein
MAWKVLIIVVYTNNTVIMNSGHLPITSHAPRSLRKQQQQKPRKKAGRPKSTSSNGHSNGEHAMAAAGTLTRTKSLLLAALKVWELKHRIGE